MLRCQVKPRAVRISPLDVTYSKVDEAEKCWKQENIPCDVEWLTDVMADKTKNCSDAPMLSLSRLPPPPHTYVAVAFLDIARIWYKTKKENRCKDGYGCFMLNKKIVRFLECKRRAGFCMRLTSWLWNGESFEITNITLCSFHNNLKYCFF